MHRIIIAMASDDLGHILESTLNTEYSIVRCFDGVTALALLQHLHPDALVLDLSLPLLSGVDVLEQAKNFKPPLVIAITDLDGVQVHRIAKLYGIHCLFRMPVEIQRLLEQIRHEMSSITPGYAAEDARTRQIIQMLLELGFKSNLAGYKQLLAGIPLVMRDSNIAMCKELYPEIARLTGLQNGQQVEHTIRNAIQDAWANGNEAAWQKYFPSLPRRKNPYPSNKHFITTIANRLRMG